MTELPLHQWDITDRLRAEQDEQGNVTLLAPRHDQDPLVVFRVAADMLRPIADSLSHAAARVEAVRDDQEVPDHGR